MIVYFAASGYMWGYGDKLASLESLDEFEGVSYLLSFYYVNYDLTHGGKKRRRALDDLERLFNKVSKGRI